MKKFIGFLFALVGLLCIPATVSADSPLTSTPFSKAYYDNPLVTQARDQGIMNSDFAAYLADENNPVDVKAAIINALSWDTEGKTNADIYCQQIYGKSLQDMDIATLTADQQFCIGYLLALDNYFDTAKAMEILKTARDNQSNSMTVAVVTYLVEAMNDQFIDWPGKLEAILTDESLNKDISEEALQIIKDYMISGIDNPVTAPSDTGNGTTDIPKTGERILWGVFAVGAVLAAAGIVITTMKKKKDEKKEENEQ